MLPKQQARCDVETLTWEYLDGQTTPTRLAHLEKMLRMRKQARETFIQSTMMDHMLHEYFGKQAEKTVPETTCVAQSSEPTIYRRRKRQRSKSNAA